ncbi:MAG: AI-2E family transporter [Pseudomonadales bacterium]|uniref:AI-2E family permease n=1 Tax=Oleiphilus messinensis TaxID=141451 RepID=A0A1Y0I7Z1_9GAMM|nr:AI-2E family transporter [Oleiphilus messinensis]ARU56618.1 AI-2E family permease [Oleiphilus messinensis]MCG8609608.1 AI-2E family transporter [Pseudomonadales bacterium]
MLKIVQSWIEKYFSDEEAVILFVLLLTGLGVVVFLGKMLAPVIASIVLAFILQGLVTRLTNVGLPERAAIIVTFLLFLGILTVLLLVLLPLIWGQIISLVKEMPRIMGDLQASVKLLPEQYPQFLSQGAIQQVFDQVTAEVGKLGQFVVSFSLQGLGNVVEWLIYIVLVPILVFFFLKDKRVILHSLAALLPKDRVLMNRIWLEMNMQFANYIRGKVVEIFVVGVVTYIVFAVFGLNYAALLAILVGLSVVIPYIGAAVVTIPVALIAFFQWGWGTEFIYLMVFYGIVQALDGNVLVPLLFSEVVNLHPVLIIVAVLFFGGVWGFWGVFFAIPLATLVKAVFSAWPTNNKAL